MATNFSAGIRSFPYLARMSNNIKSLSDCINVLSNTHKRLIYTTPQRTIVSDKLIAKPFQLHLSSQYEQASKVCFNVRLNTKISFANVKISSSRNLSSFSSQGMKFVDLNH